MSGCGHGENGIPIGVDCIFCGTDKPEVCPGCINKHNDHIDLGEGFTHSAPSVKPGEVRNLYVDRIVALVAHVEKLGKTLKLYEEFISKEVIDRWLGHVPGCNWDCVKCAAFELQKTLAKLEKQ